jgi:RNA polymerase sigma-70 factor (ECF subfamily)
MEFIDAYDRHVDDVFGFLAFRVRSIQEAEDLTQQTFERALRAWHRFDPGRASAKTWLLTIARNAYIDDRRRGERRELPVERVPDLEGDPGPEQSLSGLDPELAAALRRLGRSEREAIALRVGGDMAVAQIAELLGVEVTTVQKRLSRGLRRMRAMLDHRAVDDPAPRA